MERKCIEVNGITLVSLVITIILLLILTGVVVNMLMGDSGIIDSTISSVEKNNIATYKEKIELAIIELKAEGERNITLDKIIDKVIEKDITSEENSNRDSGQVKTQPDGYIYEIKEKEEGGWEVIYIGKGELAKIELAISVTKDVEVLTNKVTVTIIAKADSGIKSYTPPTGTEKTYSSGTKEISETYEISSNGTYTFTVENNRGKTESKEIIISNILEGTIGISANTSEATNKNVIVTVVWPSGSEAGVKEIQVGEGSWQTYEGESSKVTIEENCTIRARITSEVGEVTSTTLKITNIDKLAPKAFETQITETTTNSITIIGSTTDQEATNANGSSGIEAYYYRINGGEWKTNANPLETSYTFTDLTQGTNYTLEMKAIDKAGNETITPAVSQTTSSIAGGEGVITITPSTAAWTNQNITVTVAWPSDTTGLTKQISTNGGSTWSTYTSAVTVSSNCTVKARLIDSSNQSGTAASLTINKIDKLVPNTFTPSATVTSNSITISGSTTDQATTSTNGSSEIKAYYFSKDNGATWQNNSTLTTSSYTYTGLTQGSNYTLKMKAVDNAGNETITESITKTTSSIAGGEGVITITPSTTTWTNQNITVTVTWPSDTTGLTKQISTNGGSTWSTYTSAVTVSSNCTVKARLIDSSNQSGTAASLTITKIDKTVPTVSATSGTDTITEGDSKEVISYFTINEGGAAPCTITYTVNGSSITNTNSLEVGTHTITCTVSKANGEVASVTKTVVVESAEPANVTTATNIQSKTTEYVDSLGNKIVVPGGFKVRIDLATTVEEGIVIEDSDGNQFVWIPVSNINGDGSNKIKTSKGEVEITLGRYTFDTSNGAPTLQQSASNYTASVTIESYFTELATFWESNFVFDRTGVNATAYDLKAWIDSAVNNGGYYLARYEASFGSGDKISSVSDGLAAVTNQKPQFKQSITATDITDIAILTSTPGMLWNDIRQGDASLACRNMYAGNEYKGKDYVECDLVNSYAWDTAIVFIEKCSDNSNYANKIDGNGTLYNTGTDTGKTTDMVCNIYDMAGNLYEWTTEYSSYAGYGFADRCTYRGGCYFIDSCNMSYRSISPATNGGNNLGFRGALYIK